MQNDLESLKDGELKQKALNGRQQFLRRTINRCVHLKSRMEKGKLNAQSSELKLTIFEKEIRKLTIFEKEIRKYNIKEKDLNAQSGEVSRC